MSGGSTQRARGAAGEVGAEAGVRAEVWVAFVVLYILTWGGIQNSELLIVCFFVVFD